MPTLKSFALLVLVVLVRPVAASAEESLADNHLNVAQGIHQVRETFEQFRGTAVSDSPMPGELNGKVWHVADADLGEAPAADARRRLRGLLQAKRDPRPVVAAKPGIYALQFPDRVALGIRPAAVDVSIKLETKAVPSVNRFGECEVYVKYQAAAWQNVPSTVIHFAWSIDDQQYQDEHSGDFEWVNPSSSPNLVRLQLSQCQDHHSAVRCQRAYAVVALDRSQGRTRAACRNGQRNRRSKPTKGDCRDGNRWRGR